MTARIFEENIQLLDWQFTGNGRSITTVLDNTSSHAHLENLAPLKLSAPAPKYDRSCSATLPRNNSCHQTELQKEPNAKDSAAMENGSLYSIDFLGAINLLATGYACNGAELLPMCWAHRLHRQHGRSHWRSHWRQRMLGLTSRT